VENRVTRLEVNVEHLRSDVAEIKTDLRGLRTELRADIQRLEEKTDGIKDMIHSTRLWAIWLYMGLAAGLFSAMAGGFMWMVDQLKP